MNETTAVEVATQTKSKGRRSRGQRGSIIKRGNSYGILYRTREGKQKGEGGFRTKDQARARLDEVLPAI